MIYRGVLVGGFRSGLNGAVRPHRTMTATTKENIDEIRNTLQDVAILTVREIALSQ